MIALPLQNERAWSLRLTLLLWPLLLLLCACDLGGPQSLPKQMVGEWKTDEPRYNSRMIKLETDQITFGLGGVAPDKSEHIEKVSGTPRDNPTDYAIRLRTADGALDSITVQFTPENGGELRLKNQPKVVWRRKSESTRTMLTPNPPHETPGRDAPASNRVYGEHVTVYKIDCLRPKVCHSY